MVGCLLRVYPRVYGETATVPAKLADGMGLSPRVRGNHPLLLHATALPGSIPACTGKPSASPLAVRSIQVYPRVYGETGK